MHKRSFVTIVPGINKEEKTIMTAETFIKHIVGYAFENVGSAGFNAYIERMYEAKKEQEALKTYIDIT